MSNIKKLSEISNITFVKELTLNPLIRERLGKDKSKIAAKNLKSINCYYFTYKSQGHLVKGYMAEPKTGKNLPCIIWNRGGGKEFARITPGMAFTNSIAELAKAGYIVIASQYSGNDGGEGKDENGGSDVEDILNLFPILKKYERADATRVGMHGGSRGGMMTFLCLAKVKWIKAVVVVAPLTNLTASIKDRPEMKKWFASMFKVNLVELKKRSVIFWVNKLYKKAPILIMHGTSDWRVKVEHTLELAIQFAKKKISFRLKVYEGDDHGLNNNLPEVHKETIDWFDRFVKNGENLPRLDYFGK